MNRDRLLTVATLLGVLLVAAASAVSPSSASSGYWHTSGAQVLDSNNDPVRISGVNWYGFETTDFIAHGLWAQSYQDILNTIKGLGYNVIRIPFSNEMVESNPVPTNYNAALNPDLSGLTSLEILDKIVAYAGSIGLHIILDDHRSEAGNSAEDNGLWYTSSYPQSAWINDWVVMVTRYYGNATVIGVDLRNEPHNSASWGDGNAATDWRLAAETAGNAVLAVNPSLLICVEGIQTYNGDSDWWGGNLEGAGSFPVVLNVPNRVVYSAHDYGPTLSGQPWFNGSTTYSSLVATWTKFWGYLALDGTAPVWVGEFGSTNTDSDLQSSVAGSQGQWFRGLVRFLGANSEINWTYWALNGEDSYALLDSNYDSQPASALKQSMLASIQQSPSASGTPTHTATPTSTRTATPTPTATVTPTSTPAPTSTATAAPTPSPTPTPIPYFTVSVTTIKGSVVQGGTANYSVTITRNNGYKGVVKLSAAGLPPNTTAIFSPKSFAHGGIAKLRLVTRKKTPPGTYTVQVNGTSSNTPGAALISSASAGIDVLPKPK